MIDGLSSRTRFLDGGQLFNLDFTPFLYVFFTAFSACKTHDTIPHYKYPFNLHHLLTPSSHILSSSLSPPISLLFYSLSFCLFGVKRGQSTWGKKMSTIGAKLNMFLFTPKTFYHG